MRRYERPRSGLVCLTLCLAVVSAARLETVSSTRIAGADRIETAQLLTRVPSSPCPGDCLVYGQTAILARADAYADALAAAPLALRNAAPLLLTASTELDARVAEELTRLRTTSVILVGGTSALSSQIVEQVQALGVEEVVRLAGDDRYGTAASIARSMFSVGQVVIAEGAHPDSARGWPDAVTAAFLAAGSLAPRSALLLTSSGALPEATRAVLEEIDFETVTVVGGEVSVSADVIDELEALVPNVERVSGETRFATSTAVVDRLLEREGRGSPSRIWLASASNWPDALTAGTRAAQVGAVLLLAPSQQLAEAPPLRSWIEERAGGIEEILIVGGVAAVSDQVPEDIEDLVNSAAGTT